MFLLTLTIHSDTRWHMAAQNKIMAAVLAFLVFLAFFAPVATACQCDATFHHKSDTKLAEAEGLVKLLKPSDAEIEHREWELLKEMILEARIAHLRSLVTGYGGQQSRYWYVRYRRPSFKKMIGGCLATLLAASLAHKLTNYGMIMTRWTARFIVRKCTATRRRGGSTSKG